MQGLHKRLRLALCTVPLCAVIGGLVSTHAVAQTLDVNVAIAPNSHFGGAIQATKPRQRKFMQLVISKMNALLARPSVDTKCHQRSFRLNKLLLDAPFLPAQIERQAQIKNLWRLESYNLYIVSGIADCNGKLVNGCAAKDTNIIATNAAGSALQNAILFLHEFGHTQNLSHETHHGDHNPHSASLMHKKINTNTTKIGPKECKFFARKPIAFPVAAGAYTPEIGTLEEPVLATTATQRLLSGIWAHGAPVADLAELTPAQVAEVRSILEHPNKEQLWPHALTALGHVGDQTDIDRIIGFLTRNSEALNAVTITAKLRAPTAIGNLTARFSSPKGADLLRSSANPNSIRYRLAGHSRGQRALAKLFARNAIRGLAQLQDDALITDSFFRNLRAANMNGQFDLGVGDEFFDAMNKIRHANK